MTEADLRNPDLQQRRAADPNCNVWVAASAGSGKTKVLTDRVLSLLLSGSMPERLLCITFTKAAAAEMANRIHDRLAEWTVMPDAELAESIRKLDGRPADDQRLAIARRLFASVLDAPGGLKIQTIHGFCQSVLGRFPIEAGISPNFEVLDERSAAELMLTARNAVFLAADQPGQIQDVLFSVTRRVAEDQFAELLQQLAAKRGKLRDFLKGGKAASSVEGLSESDIDSAITRLHSFLGSDPNQSEDDVIRDACAPDAADDLGLRMVAEAMQAHGSGANQERAREVLSWLAQDMKGRVEQFDRYQRVFLTNELQPRKSVVVKAVVKAVPSVPTVIEAETDRLLRADAAYRRQATAQASASLIRLGAAILVEYARMKRSLARLDYDDLILLTRDVLSNFGAPWVLYKLDGGLDHLLIDEAQDTNPDQWRIVAALVETFFAPDRSETIPRTVFAVGDMKQSIYSFQGADPEGFRTWRGHFERLANEAGPPLLPVPMAVSFRSVDPVLRVVDAVFSLPPADDGVAEPGEALRHYAFRKGHAGCVELWPLVEPADPPEEDAWALPGLDSAGRSGGDPLVTLAEGLAIKIAALIGNEMLPARGRTVRAGDILILVRRRSGLVDALVRALKDRHVPVAGVDRMILTEQIAVMDLVAIGQVLLMPEDDLQLACVLKCPFIGFDDDDLFALAHGRGSASLWSRLRTAAETDPRMAKAEAWLSGFMNRADFMPPFELFQRVLGEACPADYGTGDLSGRQAMVARLGAEIEEPIAEFLSLCLGHERARIPSLQGFLSWFAKGRSEVKRDLEAKARDEVRIMTVHGAKGLQAPIVVLPDTTRVPRDTSSPKLHWAETGSGSELMIWTPGKRYRSDVGEALATKAAQARDREYRRLLYVAMTRAEDRLIVCGHKTARKPDTGCWYDLVQAGLESLDDTQPLAFSASGDWQGAGLRLVNEQSVVPAQADDLATAPAGEPSPEWLRRLPPPEPTPPRPLAPSRPNLPDPPVRSPLTDPEGLRFRRGRLIHRLLETLPDLPEPARADAIGRYLSAPAHALSADEIASMSEEVLAILTAPDLAPLFGSHSRAEVPITGLGPAGPDGARTVVSGQVDRLSVTKDLVLVADYKTQRPAPDRISGAPAAYIAQMARYRGLLRNIYPGKAVRCVLVWTESARPMIVPDDQMDAVEGAS